mgnify:FL=1
MEAENGEEIAYYLGHPSHIKETQRIMALSAVSQIREIGKLEMKLSQRAEPPKTPSKAPAPITPVAGAGTSGTPELGEPMPYEQYQKLGNKTFRGH